MTLFKIVNVKKGVFVAQVSTTSVRTEKHSFGLYWHTDLLVYKNSRIITISPNLICSSAYI